jgi:hypothetical protein
MSLDEIMESARIQSQLTRVPFTLPGVKPGDLVAGSVKFIVKMVDEGGMHVQLMEFTPVEAVQPQAQTGGGQISPSPS